jgi:hypothetical protein
MWPATGFHILFYTPQFIQYEKKWNAVINNTQTWHRQRTDMSQTTPCLNLVKGQHDGSDRLYDCQSQSQSQSYFTTDGQSVSQSVSRSVCLDINDPYGTCDQILLHVGVLVSEICGLISVRRPVWLEDGSAICSAITQWSESRRTRNHTLLSSETPPTWRAMFPYLHPPGTGWPSYTPGHWVAFTSSLTTRLWRLAGLRWRYLTLPQPGGPGSRSPHHLYICMIVWSYKNTSIGLFVPHRKYITSPLWAQQFQAICRFVKMIY